MSDTTAKISRSREHPQTSRDRAFAGTVTDRSTADGIVVLPDPPPTIVLSDEELEAQIRGMVADALASYDAAPTGLYDFAKRSLDIAVSAALLVLTLPIIGLLSLIIRMQSPGPAIFRQRRVGRDGHVIRFYKFRTMYSDAKQRFPEMYDYRFTAEQFANSYYKPPVDPRNTPFGRALRKTTLDELPNLFNVIKGDVSLVGPRPELPELIQYYSAEQLTKFSVKSGITGLAQVSGRNNLSIQEQIALDVAYVQKRSFLYDLKLIGLTIVMVVKRVGAE